MPVKPGWDDIPPRDWAEGEAYRIAVEIRERRKPRSAQWLADRTAELGYPLSRALISDIELGRRRYVTTAEIVILAEALETAPIVLLYPGPYLEKMIKPCPESIDIPEILAVEWFTGEMRPSSQLPISADDDTSMMVVDAGKYWENTHRLRIARRVRDLDSRRKNALREIALASAEGSDEEEVAGLIAVAESLKRQIDQIQGSPDGGRDGR